MNEQQELDRLRTYEEEFRRLVSLFDHTPTRWQFYQTDWMWRYVRGMVEGRRADEVYRERIAELELLRAQKAVDAEEEEARLRRLHMSVVPPREEAGAERGA